MIEDKLHPQIGYLVINPGTGPVTNSSEKNARRNIAHLVRDVGLDGMTFQRVASKDYGEGRFAYVLRREQIRVEVQMPGRSLEYVRFLGRKGQNAWDFPRLYVADSSWLWKYAIVAIRDEYEDPEQE